MQLSGSQMPKSSTLAVSLMQPSGGNSSFRKMKIRLKFYTALCCIARSQSLQIRELETEVENNLGFYSGAWVTD
jgi:hypothetical protein